MDLSHDDNDEENKDKNKKTLCLVEEHKSLKSVCNNSNASTKKMERKQYWIRKKSHGKGVLKMRREISFSFPFEEKDASRTII